MAFFFRNYGCFRRVQNSQKPPKTQKNRSGNLLPLSQRSQRVQFFKSFFHCMHISPSCPIPGTSPGALAARARALDRQAPVGGRGRGPAGDGYADLTRVLRALATRLCDARLVLVLEGGYGQAGSPKATPWSRGGFFGAPRCFPARAHSLGLVRTKGKSPAPRALHPGTVPRPFPPRLIYRGSSISFSLSPPPPRSAPGNAPNKGQSNGVEPMYGVKREIFSPS